MTRRGTVSVTKGNRRRNIPEQMLPQFEKQGYAKAAPKAPEPMEAKKQKPAKADHE